MIKAQHILRRGHTDDCEHVNVPSFNNLGLSDFHIAYSRSGQLLLLCGAVGDCRQGGWDIPPPTLPGDCSQQVSAGALNQEDSLKSHLYSPLELVMTISYISSTLSCK